MEYLIRQIRQTELPRLVEMCQAHADYEQALYNAKGKEEKLNAVLFSKNKKLFCYVVESNSNLAGYFTYTFDFSTWDAQLFLHLDCLYLEPEYRGKRIGEKVFEKLKAIAKENNCINIQWQTPMFNTAAIKFYKRIGSEGKDKVRFYLDV